MFSIKLGYDPTWLCKLRMVFLVVVIFDQKIVLFIIYNCEEDIFSEKRSQKTLGIRNLHHAFSFFGLLFLTIVHWIYLKVVLECVIKTQSLTWLVEKKKKNRQRKKITLIKPSPKQYRCSL